MGVGAFARYIIQKYPNDTGMGIDLESQAISEPVAAAGLPVDIISLLVACIVNIPANSSSFDYILVPGSFCYLLSLYNVRSALTEFTRVPGGGLCASMLAGRCWHCT